MNNNAKLAFSPTEAAYKLSIGKTLLYQKIRSGDLRAVKCGRKTLILQEDMDTFLNNLKNGGCA
ncbi:helix-turn-helix domain-containing protein [Terasakiella pusilla]|uniref:helix-turn-helix domain-containing protein n=1 Tax=Terasakiella pusilla TaxID=64973 RepID=UPI003AA81D5D